ncbi:hypothetical protein FHS21_000694 [Phyllobacterium trifolii]|uniref:Uncharacterized protein n=1 Tax=Phyllobacterium trifolii TaxID=300193 RepID=A0A839U102_9HYPH|nr:hypothetical protein [Phyllobacterium trifolii]
MLGCPETTVLPLPWVLGSSPRMTERWVETSGSKPTPLVVSFPELVEGQPRDSYFAALSSEALFRTLPPSSCSII